MSYIQIIRSVVVPVKGLGEEEATELYNSTIRSNCRTKGIFKALKVGTNDPKVRQPFYVLKVFSKTNKWGSLHFTVYDIIFMRLLHVSPLSSS
jgi:hypothetical protein